MKRNDSTTTAAPTQYGKLADCELRRICPIRDIGMVSERPTETIRGVVRSIAYAQQ